jgi:hypothetical protein
MNCTLTYYGAIPRSQQPQRNMSAWIAVRWILQLCCSLAHAAVTLGAVPAWLHAQQYAMRRPGFIAIALGQSRRAEPARQVLRSRCGLAGWHARDCGSGHQVLWRAICCCCILRSKCVRPDPSVHCARVTPLRMQRSVPYWVCGSLGVLVLPVCTAQEHFSG